MSDLRGLAARTKMIGVTSTAGVMTALVASSVVQATDLQIYTVPTAGKKTIIMMLDTSGSMSHTSNQAGTKVNSINTDYSLGCSASTDNTGDYPRYYCDTPALNARDAVKNSCVLNTAKTSYRCYDRLTRVKDGIYALLNSNDPVLKNVRIGLGNYSAGGDGDTGQILVPAVELNAIGSSQRNALKSAIRNLDAIQGTPTAAAYAEAAAYLMGTNTVRSGNINKDVYKKVTTNEVIDRNCTGLIYSNLSSDKTLCYQYYANGVGGTTVNATGILSNQCKTASHPHRSGNLCYQYRNQPYGLFVASNPSRYVNVDRYYTCNSLQSTNFNDLVQRCNNRDTYDTTNGWRNGSTTVPSDLASHTAHVQTNGHVIYTINEFQRSTATYSGYNKSVESTKDRDTNYNTYKSPLPAVADRQSCDGQGVYILSDGIPSDKDDSSIESVMSSALAGESFSCSGGLSGGTDWHCKSNFAQKLFNPLTNPARVSIQTAFVGFSSSFSDLSTNDVKNACKLSSRAQSDRSSDDKCSPNQDDAYKTAEGGYGNGGFFIANNANEVTNSVIQFINNLGVTPLDPLSTGAISVPVDALNPNGFQSFGYLRALEPNPALPVMTWIGNLKKYSIVDGALKDGSTTIFNDKGAFNTGTKDIWNTGSSDNGAVRLGGVYSRLQMPTIVKTQFRNLFTDLKSNSAKTEVEKLNSHNTSLLSIPVNPTPTVSLTAETLISQFKNQETLKLLSPNQKIKLLNYLGYDLDLTTNDVLPDTLTPPQDPFISMGGSIHSFPVQLTYSGDLDVNGDLTTVRQQSVLYGSMEGGLHIVDSKTGEEQMVFVPAEILLDAEKSRALRAGEGGEIQYGVSGAWVADPSYKSVRGSKDVASTVSAKTMKVYGGMRMGGYSYYGLDVIKPTNPKMLFRIDPQVSGFSRLGQTWSKPVLANVRHGGTIKRAMIVGGGYDMCYENPRFKLGTANPDEFKLKDAAGNVVDNCQKDLAKGNAIYIVDADNGSLLWSASNAGASTNNPNMKHSIVSRISTLDRDGDGLVDHLYFGDLGGQVFRADINNKAASTSDFGVRVVRLANLGESLKNDDSGDLNTGDNGDSYRFYQPPTVTIHDVGTKTFIAVGIASGDRSTPLDVTPTTQGRERLLPSIALTGRPINKVFGIFDFDFIKRDLITNIGLALDSKNLTLASLQGNPQLLTSGQVETTFLLSGVIRKYGWYRSLSSLADGTELVGVAKGGVTRVAGGVKAFEEEPIAIKNNLFIPVYDPQGTGIAQGDPCKPRIVGESNRQQYCLPFGVCLNADGTTNAGQENKTGFQLDDTDKNTNILGAGIQGITLGPKDTSNTPAKNSCGSLTLLGNITGSGQWDCQRILNPTRWYEKYVTAK
ncbi:pilus assembly protein PilY [Acinetobacter schindleri]|nr:pilus assembly protein PilY [Acinetobacter schindleri]